MIQPLDTLDANIKEYLKLLLQKETEHKDMIRKLSKFVAVKEIRKLQTIIQLEKGEIVEDMNKIFNRDEESSLKNRREIKIK